MPEKPFNSEESEPAEQTEKEHKIIVVPKENITPVDEVRLAELKALAEKIKSDKKEEPQNVPLEGVIPDPLVAEVKEEKNATGEAPEEPIIELTPLEEKKPEESLVAPAKEMATGNPDDPHFAYEKVFNDEKFLEFLGRYPDARQVAENIDPELHQKEIEKRHKVYEAQVVFGQASLNFYKKEAAEALGLPLSEELSKVFLKNIEEEAIKDPGFLLEKANELVEYERLKRDKGEWERHIREMGGAENQVEALNKLAAKEETLKKEKLTKKLSVGAWRFLNPENNPLFGPLWWVFNKRMTAEEKEWRKNIQKVPKGQRSEVFRKIDKEIEEMAKFKKEIVRFDELKEGLFDNFEPVKDVFEVLKKKTLHRLHEMIQAKKTGIAGMKNLEDAQRYLEKMKQGREVLGLQDFRPEVFQTDIDKRLELLVEEMIGRHIQKFKISSKPLESLLSGFTKLIDRDSDPKNRSMVVATVVGAIDKALSAFKASEKSGVTEKSRSEIAKAILLQVVKAQLLRAALG